MMNNQSEQELEKWLDRQLTGDLATGDLNTELRMAVSTIRGMSSKIPKDYAVQPLIRFITQHTEQAVKTAVATAEQSLDWKWSKELEQAVLEARIDQAKKSRGTMFINSPDVGYGKVGMEIADLEARFNKLKEKQ